jgi:hypothetical protein
VIKNQKPTPEHTLQAFCVGEIGVIQHLAETVQQSAWHQPQNSLKLDRWNLVQSIERNLIQKLQRQGISIEDTQKETSIVVL